MAINSNRRGGSTPIRKTTHTEELPYRGSHFSKVQIPIYMTAIREFYLTNENPVDQGFADYFSSGDNKSVVLKKVDGGYKALFTFFKDLNIQNLLNHKKTHPILTDYNITKYLEGKDVRVLPLGRKEDTPITKEELAENPVELLEEILNGIKSNPSEIEKFSAILGKNDLEWDFKSLHDKLKNGKGIKQLSRVYAEYLMGELTELVQPEKAFTEEPQLWLDFFGNQGISGLRYDNGSDKWKAQGFLFPLNGTLYYADPLSTNGSSLIVMGAKKDHMISQLKHEEKLSEEFPEFKRTVPKTNLEDFVTEGVAQRFGTKVEIDMMQVAEDSENKIKEKKSPISVVPIIDERAVEERQMVSIRIGDILPGLGVQGNNLIIANFQSK